MNIIFVPTEHEFESIKGFSEQVIVTGMGKLNITHACYSCLDEMSYPENVSILIGFCGLLKGNKQTQYFEPNVFIEGDYDARPVGSKNDVVVRDVFGESIACVSQDKIIFDPNTYAEICGRYETVITDMESYAFVSFCERNLIKNFKVVRVVSDVPNADSGDHFMNACKTNALEQVMKIIT